MKSIFINYSGGYCGSFFATLLAKSLNVECISSSMEDKNLYFYNSPDIDLSLIKPIGKLFEIRMGALNNSDLTYIIEKAGDPFYAHAAQLFKILNDSDDIQFFENIKVHFRELMKTQKNDILVGTIHYGYPYKNFSMHEVFPDSIILHIISETKRYGRYFKLLFHYKTKDYEVDKVLQNYTLNDVNIMKSIVYPEPPYLYDTRSIPVDMGKLIFERDFNHLKDVEKALSNKLGREVKLDHDKFDEYADKNVSIIKSILGEDFEHQSEQEQIKKSISYLNEKVRVNNA